MSGLRDIHLTENPNGNWTARDEETGVASEGGTRAEALPNLDEAVALHAGRAGREITDTDLEEWGIDPKVVEAEGGPPAPDAPWLDE